MPYDRIIYGAYTWDFAAIMGMPQIPSRVLKVIKMSGVDGKAFKFMSAVAKPSRLVLLAVAINQVDEEAWIAAMAELTGRQVSIYSGTGVLYRNQVFHELTHKSSEAVIAGAWGPINLGSTGRLLTFEATLEYPYGS